MRKAIGILIGEMESKLSGYAALLNYRYLNLCVKAEPMALLSISVVDEEGERKDLEDVAFATLKDKYTYEIIPKDPKGLYAICKGLLKDHPEFDQDIITPDENRKLFRNVENEQHILCKVPEVNKDRYDFLMDAVKTLYDQCKVEIEKVDVAYSAKLVTKILGFPKEEIEEAKVKMEDSQQVYDKMVENYFTSKQQEIENAYKHYLDEQAEKKAEADEQAAARGHQAGKQLRLDTDE
jgi:hypothetical protein